jgi:hypothetical protein
LDFAGTGRISLAEFRAAIERRQLTGSAQPRNQVSRLSRAGSARATLPGAAAPAAGGRSLRQPAWAPASVDDPAAAAAAREAWRQVAAVAADDPAAWARSVATLFAGYDAESRGGSIGVHELVAGLAWFGLRLNPQQAEQLKADVDEDGTGRVTLAEFSDQVAEGTR